MGTVMRRFGYLALAALASIVLVALPALAQPRVATVIGNADYQRDVLDLANPVNDANLMATVLSELGFEVVAWRNATRNDMLAAFADHRDRLSAAGPQAIGLFYYAGHGMQVNGSNHLIPIDTRVRFREDALSEPQLGIAIEWMEQAGNDVNIVILDACNDNPLPERSGLGRTGDRPEGLANLPRAAGLLIAYAAQPGRVATDGRGRNSPFTAALAEVMRQEGLIAELTFKRVAERVLAETNDEQWPYYSNGLIGAEFCFNQAGCGVAPQKPLLPAPETPAPTLSAPAGPAGTAAATEAPAETVTITGVRLDPEDEALLARLELFDFKLEAPLAAAEAVLAEHGLPQLLRLAPVEPRAAFLAGVAQYFGVTGTMKDPGLAVSQYQAACYAGLAVACAQLGYAYLDDKGIPRDAGRAVELLQQSCSDAETAGCVWLAGLYFGGSVVPADRARGKQIIDGACASGLAPACFAQAVANRTPNAVSVALGASYVPPLVQAGAAWSEIACRYGNAAECAYLGAAHYEGLGIPENASEGVRYYRLGCEGGNLDACYNVGAAYSRGKGVRQDGVEATRIFKETCEKGEMWSCASYGQILYRGDNGVRRDRRKGRQLLEQGCNAGAPLGCQVLAQID